MTASRQRRTVSDQRHHAHDVASLALLWSTGRRLKLQWATGITLSIADMCVIFSAEVIDVDV
ncbi:MAG: hypothetical protein ABR529_15830 [Actinomycetota bacterium]